MDKTLGLPAVVHHRVDPRMAAVGRGGAWFVAWEKLAGAWPNLKLGSQADDYSWNLGGGHSLTVNADRSIPATTTEARSLMKSAVLGDYISYEILSPLQAADGQTPGSGGILISGGAGNGSIRMVIESSTSVRLEIDVEGDGAVDDYQYTTWEALKG